MKRRALFLDRDGVINHDHGYVHRTEDFDFVDGIFDLTAAAARFGYLIIVVTNQAGIARGMYSEADFEALTSWMVAEFARRDIPITDVLYDPYHPIHGTGRYKQDSPNRKPKPGMILDAAAKHQVELAGSILLGDQVTDIAAGHAAGVGTLLLLQSGRADGIEDHVQVHRIADLREAVAFLV